MTDNILAMARPNTAAIKEFNIIQQFQEWDFKTFKKLMMLCYFINILTCFPFNISVIFYQISCQLTLICVLVNNRIVIVLNLFCYPLNYLKRSSKISLYHSLMYKSSQILVNCYPLNYLKRSSKISLYHSLMYKSSQILVNCKKIFFLILNQNSFFTYNCWIWIFFIFEFKQDFTVKQYVGLWFYWIWFITSLQWLNSLLNEFLDKKKFFQS